MRILPLALLANAFLVACSSSSSSPGTVTDTGSPVADTSIVDTAPVDATADAYQTLLFDNARIGSDSAKPNFQKVSVDVEPLKGGPFANVKLVIDLTSTCFPFDTWKTTNKPPAGQNWPADCDAFDRNFETIMVDPAATKETPTLELVRAITPFGGPEHIEQDVTDLYNAPSMAKGKRTIEIHITTWSDGAGKVSGSNGGWNVSAHLEVTPGPAPHKVLAVIPLYDGNYDSKTVPADLPFTLPAGTTSSLIEYRVTGHGGTDASADTACIGPAEEFCKRSHHVFVDGKTLADLTPWRADCKNLCTIAHSDVIASYCAENPCGAVSSVRAPRANWCPGSMTPPITWTPDGLKSPGDHTFKFVIDKIADGGSWRSSATLYAFGD